MKVCPSILTTGVLFFAPGRNYGTMILPTLMQHSGVEGKPVHGKNMVPREGIQPPDTTRKAHWNIGVQVSTIPEIQLI